MKSKAWTLLYVSLILIMLSVSAIETIIVDPFFHYHKPDTSKFFYSLYNERSQNDGIIKNFDYEGIISGTSMTENFKTSEAEALWNCKFIKVPFSGGTYKEINGNIETALLHNKNLKIVIRGLDFEKLIADKDIMRGDLGTYPVYLYNDCALDDVKYLFNRDIFWGTVMEMIMASGQADFEPGITSFDTYANWMAGYTFGVKTIFPEGTIKTNYDCEQDCLTEPEKKMILDNIHQNITSVAEKNPDVLFYYFFP